VLPGLAGAQTASDSHVTECPAAERSRAPRGRIRSRRGAQGAWRHGCVSGRSNPGSRRASQAESPLDRGFGCRLVARSPRASPCALGQRVGVVPQAVEQSCRLDAAAGVPRIEPKGIGLGRERIPHAQLGHRSEAPPHVCHGEVEDEGARASRRGKALELVAALDSWRVRAGEVRRRGTSRHPRGMEATSCRDAAGRRSRARIGDASRERRSRSPSGSPDRDPRRRRRAPAATYQAGRAAGAEVRASARSGPAQGDGRGRRGAPYGRAHRDGSAPPARPRIPLREGAPPCRA
jgi:hypothetical protein